MQKPIVVEMKQDSSCACGSDRRFRDCCGALRESRQPVQFVKMSWTEGHTEYFVVGNPLSDETYTDEKGRIPVFRTRAQGFQLAERTDPAKMMGVIGMTSKRFHESFLPLLAQMGVDHYMVPESTVGA